MKLSTAILSLFVVVPRDAPLCNCVVEGFLPSRRRPGPAFHGPSIPSVSSPITKATTSIRKTICCSTAMDRTGTCQIAPNVTDDLFNKRPLTEVQPSVFEIGQVQKKEVKESSKVWEFAGFGTWIAGLSSFLLVNNFVGPWPEQFLTTTPVEYFSLTHALAGMLFGGGVILTTLIEWLVTSSKSASVLNFWFGKVPGLDAFVVLPALTASIVSGVGLSVDHYTSLGEAPFHVVAAISTLLAFAGWWAVTDLTTQGAASDAIEEWASEHDESSPLSDVPQIVHLRKISNVVSCLFVAAIYAMMVLKPGA